MLQVSSGGNGHMPATLPVMAVGLVVGGLSALLGVKAKHRLRDGEFQARRISDRIAAVEDRIRSLKHLEMQDKEQAINHRLREIESRIVTAAKASDRVDPMPLRDRLAALIRQ